MKRGICLSMCAIILTGCIKPPEDIPPSYVSPLQYQSFTCSQLSQEYMRISRKAASATAAQKSEAEGDTAAMTIGLILFWPALFWVGGTDRSAEIAHLRGQVDALEQAAISKDCSDVAKVIAAERKRAEERAAAEKAAREKKVDDGLNQQGVPNP